MDSDGGLLAAVDRAVVSMSWLSDKDDAAVALAREYARQIDAAVALGGQDATKGMHLGPHLLRTLDALGGTPSSEAAPKGRPIVVDESGVDPVVPVDPEQEVRDELSSLRRTRRARAN